MAASPQRPDPPDEHHATESTGDGSGAVLALVVALLLLLLLAWAVATGLTLAARI